MSVTGSAPRRRASGFMARQLARQLGRPAGPVGHLVTHMLARSNAGFNRWLVAQLSTSIADPATVIELGCGPGIALHQLLIAYPDADVVGIDPSAIALGNARRRNADAVNAGRLRLVRGSTVSATAHGATDLILACHVLYFWTDPVTELRRIRDALTPFGHLALGYQLRQNMPPVSQRAFPAQGFILYDSDDQLADVLAKAGFSPAEVRVFGDPDRPLGRMALTTPAVS